MNSSKPSLQIRIPNTTRKNKKIISRSPITAVRTPLATPTVTPIYSYTNSNTTPIESVKVSQKQDNGPLNIKNINTPKINTADIRLRSPSRSLTQSNPTSVQTSPLFGPKKLTKNQQNIIKENMMKSFTGINNRKLLTRSNAFTRNNMKGIRNETRYSNNRKLFRRTNAFTRNNMKRIQNKNQYSNKPTKRILYNPVLSNI